MDYTFARWRCIHPDLCLWR